MKRTILVGALALLAVVACAAPAYVDFAVSIGTNNETTAVSDTRNPIGYVDEVYVLFPSGVVTADVSLISTPAVNSGLTKTCLFTNATMAASGMARPRVTQTDTAGANLSSLTVAERFFCAGDPVAFRVKQVTGVTGITFRAWLKIEK